MNSLASFLFVLAAGYVIYVAVTSIRLVASVSSARLFAELYDRTMACHAEMFALMRSETRSDEDIESGTIRCANALELASVAVLDGAVRGLARRNLIDAIKDMHRVMMDTPEVKEHYVAIRGRDKLAFRWLEKVANS